MKKGLLVLLMSMSCLSQAENLCPINEEIAEDMRIPESYFTKERAESASKTLSEIVSGKNNNYEWVTVPNLLKLIEGYVLKRDALKDNGATSQYKVSQFCNFMQNSAWWYD